MTTYYVTVCIEETIELQADDEQEAINLAYGYFDPTALEPRVVEVYTNEEE